MTWLGQCYMSRLSVTHVTLPDPECDIEMTAARSSRQTSGDK